MIRRLAALAAALAAAVVGTTWGTAPAAVPIVAAKPAPVGWYGNPVGADPYWRAQQGNDCEIQASRIAIDEVVGRQVVSPAAIAREAQRLGIYYPRVGSVWDGRLAALFRHYGVYATWPHSVSRATLEAYLAAGRPVVVAVNAGTLWGPGYPLGVADHVVVVQAVSRDGATVVLSDTGGSDTENETVPWAQFSKAWAASGWSAVVA